MDSLIEGRACSKPLFRRMICLLCQLQHTLNNIYLSRQGSQSQQHRNSSEPCIYEYEYASYLRIHTYKPVLFVRTYLYIYHFLHAAAGMHRWCRCCLYRYTGTVHTVIIRRSDLICALIINMMLLLVLLPCCSSCYKCVLLAHRHFFLFRPRVFSRALGSVACREPAGTTRRKCGPWPTSVARALGLQSWTSPRGGVPST